MSSQPQPVPEPCRVTWIEDNPADIRLFSVACEEHGLAVDLTVLTDGETAVDHIRAIATRLPDVLIVDINLPRVSGHNVIAAARENPRLFGMPIVVLTTSISPMDRELANRLGATTVAQKPNDLDDFSNLIREVVLQFCPPANACAH